MHACVCVCVCACRLVGFRVQLLVSSSTKYVRNCQIFSLDIFEETINQEYYFRKVIHVALDSRCK